MSADTTPHVDRAAEARRASRRRVDALVPVINAMTQRAMGLTRDISMGGLQLQSAEPLVDEALYQVQVELQRTDGARVPIEGGLQVVRQYRGRDGGILVGMRFIHLPKAHAQWLARWLAANGASH